MEKALAYFLGPYASEGLELRKKTRLLVITCLVGSAAAIVFAIVRALLAFDPLNLVAAVAMVGAATGTLFLTKAGHHLAGANLVVGVLSLGFFALAFAKPFLGRAVLYEYGLYCMFLNVALCLIALKSVQMLFFAFLYIAGIVCLYAFRALPAAAAGVDVGPIRSLQAGLDSGGRLTASSGAAVDSLDAMRRELSGIELAANEQHSGISDSRARGGELSASAQRLSTGLSSHDGAVQGAKTSIGTIVGSMRDLSGLAGKGREAMTELVAAAGTGERDIDAAMEAHRDDPEAEILRGPVDLDRARETPRDSFR